MKHKFTLFCLALVASAGAVFAESGTCGANLTWTLNDGVLTISGTGDMTDWESDSPGWESYSAEIKSVVIENGVTSIGDNAFYYYSDMTSVSIGNSVTKIGEYAFLGCAGLTSLVLPASVATIGESAFYWCGGLTSITCNANEPPVCGEDCFGYVDATIPVYVPKGTAAAYQAAAEWSNFTNITDASNIASGTCGAKGDNLTWVLDGSGVLTISGVGAMEDWDGGAYVPWYDYRSSILSVVIEEGVTTIGTSAFEMHHSLASVSIPNTVTTIGSYAFYICDHLTSLVLPASVTTLGFTAFYDCNGLTSITCEALTPPACNDTHCFFAVNKSIPLYVPEGTVEAYQAAEGWRNFTNIQVIGTQGIESIQLSGSSSQKILHDGQIYILRGEKVYTVTGQIVK